MIAKKQIAIRLNGDIETIENHIIKDIKDIDEDELNNILEKHIDDYEYAYSIGFSTDFDGAIFCLTVNPFLEYLKEEIECEYTDEEDKERYSKLLNSLTKYKDYIIYFQ